MNATCAAYGILTLLHAAAPPLSIETGAPGAGESIELRVVLRDDITRPFDAYLLADTAFGPCTISADGAIEVGVRPTLRDIPSWKAPLDATIRSTSGVPVELSGSGVTFYAGIIEAGKIPPVAKLDDLGAETPFVIMFASATAAVGFQTRADGAMRITAAPGAMSCQNPVFSPDGRSILCTRWLNGYNRGPSELIRVEIAAPVPAVVIPSGDADNVNVPFGSWVGHTICWASDRDGGAEEIFIANDDGTGIRRVTSHPASEGGYIEPVFNPADVNKIVFEYAPPGTTPHRVCLLELDRAGRVTDLASDPAYDDRLPSWSPDGARILFQRRAVAMEENWEIFAGTIAIEPSPALSGMVNLSGGESQETDNSWAYGGRFILSSTDYGGLPLPNIFAFPADSLGAPARITGSPDHEDGAPSYSPDGRWIAFESREHGGGDPSADIWIVPAPPLPAALSRDTRPTITAARAAGIHERLARCNDWLYLINPSGISLGEMAASGFDGVVTDYSRDGSGTGEWTPAEVSGLTASGVIALAYMSIGEAEEYRFYWQPDWAYAPPAWLGPENPDWEGNYKVRYWDSDWQRIICGTPAGADKSFLDRILDQGFDGVYLDIVDAYWYWSEANPELSRAEARARMIDFVAAIADYARVTRGHGDFLVLPQNAEEIILGDNGAIDAEGERYLAACDGVGAEDVWYNETGVQPADQTAYRVALLDAFRAHNGSRTVLSVDYVWDESDPTGPGNRERYNDYHRNARLHGFLAYAASSDRTLDTIIFRARGDGFDYAQPEPGTGGNAVIELNGADFVPGARFTATFRLDQSITRPFTAYAAVIMPDGSMRDARTLAPSLAPVAENTPGLEAPFGAVILDIDVPDAAPSGGYEIVAAFFDPAGPIAGRGDSFLESSAGFTVGR